MANEAKQKPIRGFLSFLSKKVYFGRLVLSGCKRPLGLKSFVSFINKLFVIYNPKKVQIYGLSLFFMPFKKNFLKYLCIKKLLLHLHYQTNNNPNKHEKSNLE